MKWLRRLARCALGLALGFALLEALLWGLAFARQALARRPAPAASAEHSWLALGDSHTYGWNVSAEQAWPAQLEALVRAQGVSLRIANEGVPGNNTSTILASLPELLERHRPELVLVLAGLNNPYSRPDELGALERLLSHTRSWKLWRALRQRVARAPLEGTPTDLGNGLRTIESPDGRQEVRATTRSGETRVFRIGNGNIAPGEGALGREWIARELAEIAAQCASAGAECVLLTYAREEGDFVPPVNFAIRTAATREGLRLFDLASELAPGIAQREASALFFHDLHPRPAGYALIARQLHDDLVASGLLQAPKLGDAWAGADSKPARGAELEWLSASALALRGEAEQHFTVLLARAPGEGPSFGEYQVRLAADELFALSKAKQAELSGQLDAQGRAELVLPPEIAQSVAQGPACAVLVLRSANWTVLGVSAPIGRQP